MPHDRDFLSFYHSVFLSFPLFFFLSTCHFVFLTFCISGFLSICQYFILSTMVLTICNLYNTCQLLWQQWQGMQLTAWLSTHCSNARVPWASAEHQKRKIRRKIFYWKIRCWWFYLDSGEVQIWLQRANKATGNCGSIIDCHCGRVDVLSPLEWFPEYCADICLGT